jgi:Tfp pilus assembly protein PilF
MSSIRFITAVFLPITLLAQMHPSPPPSQPWVRARSAPENLSTELDAPDPLEDSPFVLQVHATPPASATVSIRDLQHPIPGKALRAAIRAQQYFKTHDFTHAIAKLEQAIRIHPSFRDAHNNLGVVYSHAGRLPDAAAEFRKALEIGPSTAPLYVNLALACAAQGQLQEATASLRQALQVDPANPLALKLLQPASAP